MIGHTVMGHLQKLEESTARSGARNTGKTDHPSTNTTASGCTTGIITTKSAATKTSAVGINMPTMPKAG